MDKMISNNKLLIKVLFITILLASYGYSYDKPLNQKSFKNPKEAANTLFTACKNNNNKKLIDIFGHNYKNIISSGDKVLDKNNRLRFYKIASEKWNLKKKKNNKLIIVVGKIGYPFPIPLIKENRLWRFDTPAGIEEIINRRIGENEITAIKISRAYIEAQKEYAQKDRDNDEVIEYAQKFISTPGKKDGLYWPIDIDYKYEISPIGELIAEAQINPSNRKGKPYHGYYYKILTAQGKNAPGGPYSYIINKNMVAGCALIAYPARYNSSGIMTFIINNSGKVYEKNLGLNTHEIVKKIKEYNPDNTWTLVK